VSCFTYGRTDAVYGLDIAERSVMVAGPATALLGVSSLDLAPLAATSGAFFVDAGYTPCRSIGNTSRNEEKRGRRHGRAKNKTRRPRPARNRSGG
jgi:hypothetical protein